MTTPTAVTELVTLSDAIDHLNLTDTSSLNTAELQKFIDAATAYIQNFTGPVIGRTFTEVHSGGGPTICLRNPPVLAVISVVEYVGPTGYTLSPVSLGDPTGSYAYSLDIPAGGILRRRFNGGLAGNFIGGHGNIAVTYIAGTVAVAADIRMAVLQDIAGLFQPSQLGGNPYDAAQGLGGGNAPLNPIGMFPRVAEILSAPTMRVPAIG